MNNTFKKNLIFAFIAQSSSLLLSVLMSLIVPKFLSVENFGYWQLFLFYVSYAGLFHFGLTDGIYLKLGGTRYEDLDKKDINNQFHILLLFQVMITVLIVVFSIFFVSSIEKSYILIISAIYIIIANLNWFLGYVFQATNLTKIYSLSVMIDRIAFIVFVILTFVFKLNNFYLLMILYTITRILALIYCLIKAKDMIKISGKALKQSLKNTIDYIKIGINLTLSSVASMLIVGIGRFFVEKKWGIEEFSKFSFSISITNFFLTFIQQISMVLFPALRQINDHKRMKDIYYSCRIFLNIMLPCIFILYIPCKVVLTWWLPQYEISLTYLAILLPLCVFDGKMQLLSNTYMKVYRKERILLVINVFALAVSLVFSIIGTYLFNNTYVVIIGLLLAIILRSVISEIYLANVLKINMKKEILAIVMEVGYSALFIIVSFNLNSMLAFLTNIVLYCLYLWILKDNVKVVAHYIRQKLQK